jgi:hypothetical protein
MARFDDLPADQKAVLQLILQQGRTYDDIAGLLKIPPAAVRDRALTALDSLGPDDPQGLSEEHQDEIGDYVLGQQSASQRAATRELLAGSGPARAWARATTGELREGGVPAESLPDIPADTAEVDEAFDALEARQRARADRDRSSRLGGLLLLVGVGIVVALIILVLTGTLGDNKDDPTDNAAVTTSTATTATSTGTSTTGQTTVEAQINLRPPGGGSKALGVANIVRQDGKRAIAIIAQDLPAGSRYALWLYSSPEKARRLGFFPPVSGSGSAKGRLQGLVEAPDDLSEYQELVVTRETSDSPSRPGQIVLRGPIGS